LIFSFVKNFVRLNVDANIETFGNAPIDLQASTFRTGWMPAHEKNLPKRVWFMFSGWNVQVVFPQVQTTSRCDGHFTAGHIAQLVEPFNALSDGVARKFGARTVPIAEMITQQDGCCLRLWVQWFIAYCHSLLLPHIGGVDEVVSQDGFLLGSLSAEESPRGGLMRTGRWFLTCSLRQLVGRNS
jgi:hypothetical protein